MTAFRGALVRGNAKRAGIKVKRRACRALKKNLPEKRTMLSELERKEGLFSRNLIGAPSG